MAQGDLMQKFRMSNVLIKLIVVNVIVFFVFYLGAFILRLDESSLKSWFALPLKAWDFLYKPWTFFTYTFLHSGFWHIFWNMLILYWFGNIVLNLFKERTLLSLYLLGGVAGGLMSILAFNIFPVFSDFTRGSLQGASGAVFAVMLFIATYNPNAEIRVFMFNIKLWQIAAFFVLKDLIALPASDNAGGLMAHIGGAVFGYTYAKQLAKGNNIGAGFERLMDQVVGWFTPRKKRPFKKVHRNPGRSSGRGTTKLETKDEKQKRVDAILDKISKSGYESLSKAEKDYLFKAGNDSN